MKRSEMLEKIRQVLRDVGPEIQAEEILKTIEEAGMLPPVIREKSVLPGISDFEVRKWEPEGNLTGTQLD
jgi:hypothetical protein